MGSLALHPVCPFTPPRIHLPFPSRPNPRMISTSSSLCTCFLFFTPHPYPTRTFIPLVLATQHAFRSFRPCVSTLISSSSDLILFTRFGSAKQVVDIYILLWSVIAFIPSRSPYKRQPLFDISAWSVTYLPREDLSIQGQPLSTHTPALHCKYMTWTYSSTQVVCTCNLTPSSITKSLSSTLLLSEECYW